MPTRSEAGRRVLFRQAEQFRHTAMVRDPVTCRRAYPSRDSEDRVVVSGQMALEDWFVMGDPVPEGPQVVELLLRSGTAEPCVREAFAESWSPKGHLVLALG